MTKPSSLSPHRAAEAVIDVLTGIDSAEQVSHFSRERSKMVH